MNATYEWHSRGVTPPPGDHKGSDGVSEWDMHREGGPIGRHTRVRRWRYKTCSVVEVQDVNTICWIAMITAVVVLCVATIAIGVGVARMVYDEVAHPVPVKGAGFY